MTQNLSFSNDVVLNETNYSTLPFRAYKKDRDEIDVHFVSLKAGHKFVSTDDSESLPYRTLQLDQENGYNRLIFNSIVNGRSKDKSGNSIDKQFTDKGAGIHLRSFGNLFETMGEMNCCYGKNLFKGNSYFTMLGGDSKPRFERYYQRDIATIIHGTNRYASTKDFSYRSSESILLNAKKGNITVDNKSEYDSAPNAKDKSSGKINIELTADEDIIITAKKNIYLNAKNIFLNAEELVKIIRNLLIDPSGGICCSSMSTVLEQSDEPKEATIPEIPKVKITKGYDEFPDEHKAIYEDIWRVESKK